ncbi:MAG: UvrD-helicase domain-containing protein [Planctomycetes bacterium]|nr:UvrD-helicase domain-containing protein [Planctomycetota bacterium]
METLRHVSRPFDLTARQWEAIDHLEGPLLVLAGPGSGKTRVITRRIARMVERGVDPRSILAITFTNKAAGEMQSRVAELLPGRRIWVSTFHKFCARVLRGRAEAVGLAPGFSIYDTADQRGLVRDVLAELEFDPVHYPTGRLLARIGRAKNDLVTAEAFGRSFKERVGDQWQAVTARVYTRYQQRLKQANAVDFDDLLLWVVELLEEHEEIRDQLSERYRYVLVDEYQDTNLAQYRIVQALAAKHRNLCVTGDPDQSIYGWRGARIDNILRFERDFPEATVVRLEENFRSTQSILEVADRLIAHNVLRKAKSLTTGNAAGRPVEVVRLANEQHEARWIAEQIAAAVAANRRYSDFAVFYRVNALTRELEQAFRRRGVPYQVAAGAAFYDRAEIKDMLAYLRLVHNPGDRAAFLRVVNAPPRGIGKVTQQRLLRWADAAGLGVLEAAARADECPELKSRPARLLQAFAAMIEEFSAAARGSVEELLALVLHRTAYGEDWIDSESEQDRQRLANVQELLTAAHRFDEEYSAETAFDGSLDDPARSPGGPLEAFLESVSLASETDDIDESAGAVTLMTLHAAKGLEFPVVFLVGLEEGLLPHERSMKSEDQFREIEEERRLLFVGITRAKEELYLTETDVRDFRGRRQKTIPSPFRAELTAELTDLAREAASYGVSAGYSVEDESQDVPGDEHLPPEESDREEPEAATPHGVAQGPGARFPGLKTGADLLAGKEGGADVPRSFAVGAIVRHPRYGLGTVISLGGYSRNRSVTVLFEEDGRTQTFVVTQCPLQPVGML